MSAPAPTLPKPPRSLPTGVVLSKIWRTEPDGPLMPHAAEQPVLEETYLRVGSYTNCPVADCKTGEWIFPEVGAVKEKYCPDHGQPLLIGDADPNSADPQQSARDSIAAAIRRNRAQISTRVRDAANARAAAARNAAAAKARQVGTDIRGHIPSAVIGAAALAAGAVAVAELSAADRIMLSAGLILVGTPVTYLAAYYIQRAADSLNISHDPDTGPVRASRAERMATGRWAMMAPLLGGTWLAVATLLAPAPVGPKAIMLAILGVIFVVAGNYLPWTRMVRARQAAIAALLAEAEAAAQAEQEAIEAAEAEARARDEAARKAAEDAAEAARLAAEEAAKREGAILDTDTAERAGEKFAKTYATIADASRQQQNGPSFDMTRTWILPEETKKLTAADTDGTDVLAGWEFAVESAPGELATRGDRAPFPAMLSWFAAMLGVPESTISLIDRPDDTPNRALIVLSETGMLTRPVDYPIGGGVVVHPDGKITGFQGRSMRGRAVHRTLYVPGQPLGGGRYGHTGGGKTVSTQRTILADLYATKRLQEMGFEFGGILPVVHDGLEAKRGVDFMDFIGIIPIGVTQEHRDVMYRSLISELRRRVDLMSLFEVVDRHGRTVSAEARWNMAWGSAIRWTLEEFHSQSKDTAFMNALLHMVRIQRATAIGVETSTQGGGLTDTGDSVLRDLLNLAYREIMKMGDAQARLTGYEGQYRTSKMPQAPGWELQQDGAREVEVFRGAFPHREDRDGSIMDHLYAPDGTQLLFAPTLPAETREVFEREGLMDLWRLAQGPGGKGRLLADVGKVASSGSAADAGLPEPGQGDPNLPRMEARDVVLAILLHASGALTATDIWRHPWWAAVASGQTVLSTVTRALIRLTTPDDEAKLIDGAVPLVDLIKEEVPNGGKPRVTYALGAAGQGAAQTAYRQLLTSPVLKAEAERFAKLTAGADGDTQLVDLERAAFANAEQKAMVDAEAQAMREALTYGQD